LLNSPSSKVPTPGAVGERKGKPAKTSRKANIEDKDDDEENFLEFSGEKKNQCSLNSTTKRHAKKHDIERTSKGAQRHEQETLIIIETNFFLEIKKMGEKKQPENLFPRK
jgi:GTP cyclohydrolase I